LPGPVEICAWVTDGDIECDKHRCITVVCPDLCENVVCDDGNECTADRCDPLNGLCSNDVAPDGIACNNCGNTCQAGACTGVPITADQTGSVMTFVGTIQQVNMTLVNPYSGASLPVSGLFNYNIHTYLGDGTSVLTGTNEPDVLLVQDPVGTQRICGVATISALNGIDVMFLADKWIFLNGMTLEGGNAGDILCANAGDDTLLGHNGDDNLDGGPGNDIIEGGLGSDTITLWPGSGFDSISGGTGTGIDRVEIDAIQSQILITPAANPSYEYDVFARGVALAEFREVELLVLRPDPSSVLTELVIDLATCVGGAGDVCNLCGNDALNGGEECDDGNNVSGDGCTAVCTSELP
jgi:cysteine-rich repeat protein